MRTIFTDYQLNTIRDIVIALESEDYFDTVYVGFIEEAVANTIKDLGLKSPYNMSYGKIFNHIKENYI